MLNRYILMMLVSLCFAFSVSSKTFDTRFDVAFNKSELKEDEGYLLVHLRNYDYLQRLVFSGEQDKVRFKKISRGDNFALVKLKAGTYHPFLLRLSVRFGYIDFRPDKELYSFEVKPRMLNYPGSLISDWYPSGLRLYSINNATSIRKKLQAELPHLLNRYHFRYTGKFPDPYFDFIEKIQAKKQSLGIDSNTTLAQGLGNVLKKYENGEINIFNRSDDIKSINQKYPSLEQYFSTPENGRSIISPSGRLLLRKTYDKDSEYVEVMNLTTQISYRLYGGDIGRFTSVKGLTWISDSSFYFSVDYGSVEEKIVAHMTVDDEYEIKNVDFINIPADGYLIDPLIGDENHILFAYFSNKKHRRDGVYKVNVSNEETVEATLKRTYFYHKKFKGARLWLTDKDSRIRFAAAYNEKDETVDYWFLAGEEKSDWKKIHSFKDEEDFIRPQVFSADSNSFFVITDKFHDKRGVYRYSIDPFEWQETIFEDDNIDVSSIIFDDETSQVVGVRYIEDGRFHSIFFESNSYEWMASIKQKYPESSLFVTQIHRASNQALMFGTHYASKGTYYLVNTQTEEIRKLFDISPVYETLDKGRLKLIKAKTDDGLDIEAYLMMPDEVTDKVPLIVLPHGGPIGVRDFALNDSMQHFLASQGIASIKVNYRGSGGFGKKFEELGKLEWGKKIESDINQSVSKAILEYPIDETKICAVGSSYGGYSALMLNILFPERYRCSVSMAGVTDIPLIFTSSDTANRDESIEGIKKIIGDPEKQLNEMMSHSPVYLADKLNNPVLLVHGFRDLRVTMEHSLRLKESMNELGKPVDLLVLANEKHSLSNIESRLKYAQVMLDFIKASLKIN